MQCPAIGSCLIEEFCGTYYQQGVPPCASKLVEVAPSASANTGSPKLPHVDMDDVRLLESFMAHRAPAQTPTWEAWSRVKAALVEVRQLRASA
jgi:hypothetical protein